MVYSCSWPAYLINNHPNYTAIAEHCNLWRNFDDIADSWDSVLSIIDFYTKNEVGTLLSKTSKGGVLFSYSYFRFG